MKTYIGSGDNPALYFVDGMEWPCDSLPEMGDVINIVDFLPEAMLVMTMGELSPLDEGDHCGNLTVKDYLEERIVKVMARDWRKDSEGVPCVNLILEIEFYGAKLI